MKKMLYIAVAVLFCLFLVLGSVLNFQQGLSFQDRFWRRTGDGSFICMGDRVRSTGADTFELTLSGQTTTARQSTLSDGGVRMDYSDGWAVERSSEDDFLFEFGAFAWGYDAALILTDRSALDVSFAPAARTETTPFYNEDGAVIGETVQILSAGGDLLSLREIWYDRPELNSPDEPPLILKEGMRLEGMSDAVIQNEQGQYLLESQRLGRLPGTGTGTDRRLFTHFLLRIGSGELERRGDGMAIFFYVLLYALGAAQLIWPEQLAFFGSRWWFRDEPALSDAGHTAMFLGGAALMLFAVITLFIFL